MIAGAIFLWQSRAQRTIALSSTEAEYMALSYCSWQAVWIKSLLNELDIDVGPIHINSNNQGSLFIGSNPVQEKWSKHIDIHYHFIRQCVEEKKISLFYVKGAENPADMFTKNLGKVKFLKFRSQLGLEFDVACSWGTCSIYGRCFSKGSVEQMLNKHSRIRCAACDCHHMTSQDVV